MAHQHTTMFLTTTITTIRNEGKNPGNLCSNLSRKLYSVCNDNDLTRHHRLGVCVRVFELDKHKTHTLMTENQAQHTMCSRVGRTFFETRIILGNFRLKTIALS